LRALSRRTYALPGLLRCHAVLQDHVGADARAQRDAGSTGAEPEGRRRMSGDPMKIYWPIGLTRDMPGRTNRSDLFDEALNAYARAVMGPNVAVTIGWMRRTTGVMSSLYLGMINDTQIVSDILDAERDGHAAATVGGHWDPALGTAREAAGIPVVGPGEAAMLLSGTLGRKFAFLTVMEGYVPIIENNIRSYGLEARAIARRPVRKFGMTYENIVRCLEGKDDEFLVEMTKTARECIADGADVIIAGGQLFGPIFQKHKFFTIPDTGVPVVEVSACGLKLAQTLAELARTVSLRKSEHVNAPFRTPPREVVDEMRRKFSIV
jgi:allantoin racemase